MAGAHLRSILTAVIAFAVCIGLTAVLAAPLGPGQPRETFPLTGAAEAIHGYDQAATGPTSRSLRTIHSYDTSARDARLNSAAIPRWLAAEGAAEARTYINLTRGASIRNIGTYASHTEFAQTLAAEGWRTRTSADGAVQIFEKDGARYVLRNKTASYGGWTADYYASGSSKITLKLRLGHQ